MMPYCVLITWADGTHTIHGPFRGSWHAMAYAEDIRAINSNGTKAEARQIVEPVPELDLAAMRLTSTATPPS